MRPTPSLPPTPQDSPPICNIVLCPLASSILTPASDDLAADYDVPQQSIIGAQSGFVHMLGFGPLLLAPLSETFGRRPIFLTNLAIFTLLQIPTALAPNLPTLIALRTVAGIFGSVGIANGGGTISDLFPAAQRATVLGVYLLGPLLGPSLGPFLGGMINVRLQWRWIIWVLLLISAVLWVVCYLFLFETYAPMILDGRRKKLQRKNPDTRYRVEGASQDPVWRKITAVCYDTLPFLPDLGCCAIPL